MYDFNNNTEKNCGPLVSKYLFQNALDDDICKGFDI